MVIMISTEARSKKPYALPVQCILYGPGMLKQLLWHHLLIGISIAIIVNFGILGRYWVGVATAPQSVPFPISAFSCNFIPRSTICLMMTFRILLSYAGVKYTLYREGIRFLATSLSADHNNHNRCSSSMTIAVDTLDNPN